MNTKTWNTVVIVRGVNRISTPETLVLTEFGSEVAKLCEHDFGPVPPVLPIDQVHAENERLRAALREVADIVDSEHVGAAAWGMVREAARKALE